MKRAPAALAGRTFDLLVVGAGIYGACIARDAARRGLSVALVDRGDFGGGNSHNSLKIIHGGLRYLQHLDVRRLLESARERHVWLTTAPHLVRPLGSLMPTRGHGPRGPEAMRVAIRLHEVLARFAGRGLRPLSLRRGEVWDRTRAAAFFADVPTEGLSGAALWYDAQMQDADRLLLGCIRDAVVHGAVAANYVEATTLLGPEDRVEGVRALERLDGAAFDIRARLTVNACGPWGSALVRGRSPPLGALSRASNIVTRQLFAEHAVAVVSRRPSDAVVGAGPRLYFVTPWQGRSVIGTTHLPFAGDAGTREPDEREMDETEIAEFLAELADALPAARLTRADVLYAYRGLQPAEGVQRGEVRLAHEDKVIDHARQGLAGLVSVWSVKYTTARSVAQRVVDLAAARLGGRYADCSTAMGRLPGAAGFTDVFALEADAAPMLGAAAGTDEARRFLTAFGTGWRDVLGAEPIADGLDLFRRRVRHAVAAEMAVRLDDVVFRRLEHAQLGELDPERLAAAAEALGSSLGWSAATRAARTASVAQQLARHGAPVD
jgi:glycerol-3-phosphate dehydrogenase